MEIAMSRVELVSAQRLIVKIGSSLIADPDNGEIRDLWLETLVDDVSKFFARGQQLIIVTSGAVAIGSCHLNRLGRPLRIVNKQTAAAIGQARLMVAYATTMRRHGLVAGQILFTMADIDDQICFRNVQSMLEQLLKVGAIPIINENDTIASSENCFGDNDRLAARVAQMVNADVLILLSDVDGLFTEDPHHNPLASQVTQVRFISPEIEAMAAESPAGHGTGGMVTKLMAARIAMDAGCKMVIAKGNKSHPLTALENGGLSTWFFPQGGE